MTLDLNRGNTSIVARWWYTTDRVSLLAMSGLIVCGVLLILTATPPVAERLKLSHLYFSSRHLMLLPLAVIMLGMVSMLPVKYLKICGGCLFFLCLIASGVASFWGPEIKGAQRWLFFNGLSIQPSEFLKPAFAVVAAWAFQYSIKTRGRPLGPTGFLLLFLVLAVLISQPDFGMSLVVVAGWTAQFFVAGATWVGLTILLAMSLLGVLAAYHALPHVVARIDVFFDPSLGDTYQIQTSVESFVRGGFFGRGPGEGLIKQHLPDAHTDFIFAVAGEEFGFFFCLIIVLLYLTIIMRGFSGAMLQADSIAMLAATGLLTQVGLQALINMGSALQLIPSKGMTLPLISYGGSSLLATALTLGMVIAFTRRRFDTVNWS